MSNNNRKRGSSKPTGTTPMTTPETTAADQAQPTEQSTATETQNQPQDTESEATDAGVEQGNADSATMDSNGDAFKQEEMPVTQAPAIEIDVDVLRNGVGGLTVETESATPTATSMGVIPEPKPALDVSKLLREKGDFEQAIDLIIAEGSVVMKTAAVALREYDTIMGAAGHASPEVINYHQGTLWRVIRTILNSGEDFEAGLNLLLAFMRNGKDGAFGDINLFRGFEHTRMNALQSKAFQAILTLLSTASSVNNRNHVRKTIDLGRTMASEVFSPEARTRVLGFFA